MGSNLSESKESQVRVELFVLCVHIDCEELQLQQGQRLLEDRKGEVRDHVFYFHKC